jgi:hypothetical protein
VKNTLNWLNGFCQGIMIVVLIMIMNKQIQFAKWELIIHSLLNFSIIICVGILLFHLKSNYFEIIENFKRKFIPKLIIFILFKLKILMLVSEIFVGMSMILYFQWLSLNSCQYNIYYSFQWCFMMIFFVLLVWMCDDLDRFVRLNKN